MQSSIGKTVVVIALVMIGLGVYGKFGPGIPIQSVVTQKQDLFTVSGDGKVTVVPDTGIVDLGITTNQSTVKAAQNEANTAITNISKALRDLGVDSKDIKTSNYSVYPQYEYTPGSSVGKISGYQVNANLTVTVREIDKLNQVVDSATNNGANTIGGIQLTVDESKRKELLQDARDAAVKEAKTKAESLAKSAGITLGKIINVVETGNTTYPMPMMYAKDAAISAGGGGSPTNIQTGSTDITTSVTLFYETR